MSTPIVVKPNPDYAIAYLVLYSQEFRKNPQQTPASFKAWLHAEHHANVKTAKAQFDAKQAAKKEKK